VVIIVADAEVPDAILAISVVPSDCISSIAIQYLRSPVPASFRANRLLIHNPGIIVVVSNAVAGDTN
jgi:hypothetical protein